MSFAAHLFGIFLAAAVLVLLVVFAALHSGAAAIVGMSLFGAALLLFYIMKAVYFWTEIRKHHSTNVLAHMQQASLYILVASTYTPVALLLPQRAWGWSIFGIAWGISLFAALLRLPILFTYAVYFAMDTVAFSVVHAYLNTSAEWFFGVGGLAYMIASLLERKRKTGGLPFALIGSMAHFWAMLVLVLTS